jgi:multidrug efflux pump subunit AcrA (membrane-fusion protein)
VGAPIATGTTLFFRLARLDPTTRTLVTEVQVPNPQGFLRPGMFVNVTIQNQRSNPPILVPGDALMVDATGAHIGVLRDVRRLSPEERPKQPSKTEKKRGPGY